MIKVKEKAIESENFFISMIENRVLVNRKQNIIKKTNVKDKKPRSNSTKHVKQSPKKEKVKGNRDSRIVKNMER